MRGIQKEMSRRFRNRNQYLYVRSIGPGCCTTATQGGEWLSRKIPRAVFWTSLACTASLRHPRWIIYPSEPFLGDQKLRNCRERGLDRMEGDSVGRLMHASVSHVTRIHDPLAVGSELPRSCRNHSLLHTQRYCHWFAHSRLQLVSFWMPLI